MHRYISVHIFININILLYDRNSSLAVHIDIYIDLYIYESYLYKTYIIDI